MNSVVQRVCGAVAGSVTGTAAPGDAAAPGGAYPADGAQAAARAWLEHALGCMFRALRDPACAPLLGPPVPGATLPLGARVPGTSLELDPASAAFNLGAMIRGPRACVADHLAVLIAAADYAARRSYYDGHDAPTVADLLAALARAASLERGLAADAECGADPWFCQRVAGAAVAAALLGGSAAQQAAAAQAAALDGSPLSPRPVAPSGARPLRRAAGENAARAMRHALAALRDPDLPLAGTAADVAPAPAAASYALTAPAALDEACSGAAFDAAVAALFPAAQAAAILQLWRGDARLAALPVDQFVARLVRN